MMLCWNSNRKILVRRVTSIPFSWWQADNRLILLWKYRKYFFLGSVFFFLHLLLFLPNLAEAAQDRAISAIRKTANQIGVRDYDPGRFHALVIGINKYRYLDNLQTAVADAKAVSRTLEELYGFGTVELLLDDAATRSNILRKLRHLRDTLTEEDSLLIYYAGHGRLEAGSNVGSWVPTDGVKEDNIEDIPNSRIINDYLKKLKVRHLLLLSDSCFSGSMVRGTSIGPENASVLKRFAKPSRFILTSGDLQPVPDDAGNGHSPFCNRIIQFLRSESAVFDVHDLYGYLKALHSEPLLESLDTSAHQPGGSFVFIRQNASSDELAHFSRKITQVVQQSTQTAEIAVPPSVPVNTTVMGKSNVFSFTSPAGGILTIQGRTHRLADMPELALVTGQYPFTLQVPDSTRLIYGIFNVLLVDDETSSALFGATDPLFKQRHIQAALKGSPVRYSIGVSSKGKRKIVAQYKLSLRKIY